MIDPATASTIASGLAGFGQSGPAVSGTGPTSVSPSVYVEGMQVNRPSWVWPAAIAAGLVGVWWLNRK